MKDEGWIVLIVGGFVLLFWAFSRGLIGGGVGPTGVAVNPQTGVASGAIQVPQPSSNYSGYLAATTAPGVASAVNTIIGGLGTTLSGWFSGGSNAPQVAQGPAAPASAAPSAAAQPAGPTPINPITGGNFYAGANAPAMLNATAATPIGPITAPDVTYDATSGSAFDYNGLSGSNAYDPTYAMLIPDTGVMSS